MGSQLSSSGQLPLPRCVQHLVCSLAAAQLQAAEAAAEAEEAQQRRQPGRPRRGPAPPRP